MKYKWLDNSFPYDGSQLSTLHNYLKHGLLGDSVVAWMGPCEVIPKHMADGEDLRAQAIIRGDMMLHFVIEKFDSTLMAGVALQRLLASIVKDEIQFQSKSELARQLVRQGDDLYSGDRKLSISVAAQSPISTLIHFAVNITNTGTPVPTISLQEFGVSPKELANQVMSRFAHEVETIQEATWKVRPVISGGF